VHIRRHLEVGLLHEKSGYTTVHIPAALPGCTAGLLISSVTASLFKLIDKMTNPIYQSKENE